MHTLSKKKARERMRKAGERHFSIGTNIISNGQFKSDEDSKRNGQTLSHLLKTGNGEKSKSDK